MTFKRRNHPTLLSRYIDLESDWTIPRLAEKLGVNRQTVGKWIAGKEPTPRRRQAQIRIHLEEPYRPWWGPDKVALPNHEED